MTEHERILSLIESLTKTNEALQKTILHSIELTKRVEKLEEKIKKNGLETKNIIIDEYWCEENK